MAISRLLTRPMLASVFFLGAVNALRNAEKIAPLARPVTDKVGAAAPVALPSNPVIWVRANAVTQLVAATALATGTAPRLSSSVLAASLVPTTLAGHAYWNYTDPDERNAQRLQFFKNVGVLGGLLTAAGDTAGEPGVAWRVRNAARQARRDAGRTAKDARREARHLAKSARQEARLAKAQLG